MACGAIAFTLAGIPIDEYHAYEIDKFAIQAATHNFPFIEEHGDVFQADFTQYEEFDYLIGGSPCTYWSIAQSPDKRETVASGMGWDLFSQYTRALKEAKPKYFIYENNKSMAKPIYDAISDAFGFEPIMINSALVSAQNRERYYWVGIRNDKGKYDRVRIEQPKERGITMCDVIEGGTSPLKKGYAIITGKMTTTTVAIVAEYCGTLPCIAASAAEGIFLFDKSVSILLCILIRRSCKGFLLSLSINRRAFCQSFQYMVAIINPTDANAGFISGNTILKKVVYSPAPSILAESINSPGTLLVI